MRLRLAPTVDAVWAKHPYARLAVLVLGGYDLVFGAVLALSGPARTSAASFITINDNGGPVVWGAALVLVGILVLTSPFVSRHGVAWTLGLAAAAHLFLAGGFVVAILDRPDAALTGPFTYGVVSASHAVQCVLHRRTVPSTP